MTRTSQGRFVFLLRFGQSSSPFRSLVFIALVYHPAIMTADADEPRRLAELYSGMIDAELGQIARDPGSLTDAAQNALAAEVRRRELAVDRPELVEGYDEAEYRNLVTIRKFRDLPEALLAKGKLDSAGIESCLVDDNMVRILFSNFVGGVRLQVRPVDANPAAEILEESIPENFDVGSGESWQPRCPACYSPDVSFKELVRTVPKHQRIRRLAASTRLRGLEVPRLRPRVGGHCPTTYPGTLELVPGNARMKDKPRSRKRLPLAHSGGTSIVDGDLRRHHHKVRARLIHVVILI